VNYQDLNPVVDILKNSKIIKKKLKKMMLKDFMKTLRFSNK
jgi:hypothetical protein